MITTLLIASLLAAPPEEQQLELLKTFRKEFVELTPGENGFPPKFYRGNAAGKPINPSSQRLLSVDPFAIAKYEVPQNLYEAVMGENPSRWKGPRNSVEEVTHADAVEFCRKATKLMREAKLIPADQVVELPSEVQWEYACKAGTTTAYSFGNDDTQIDHYAWHTGNAAGNDPPVGAKKPNPWGLYDMHGYLWEWTSSAWAPDVKKPDRPETDRFVVRGGSWKDKPAQLMSHVRVGMKATTKDDAVGFRCILVQDSSNGNAVFKPAAQDRIVAASAELQLLWNDGEFTEGPAWSPEGHLLFSDIGNTIYRYQPETGKVSVYRAESNRANGLAFNSQGELIACEGANEGGQRISVTNRQGKVRTLADSFHGKRFNSPNDLAIDPQGNVYFTDPRYVGEEPLQLDFEGVFIVAADGQVRIATREVTKPNGIAITNDGKHAYVADHDSRSGGPRHLLKFEIAADGTFTNKQVLHDFGNGRGIDGMALGTKRNIYAAAGRGEKAGVYVFDPQGKQLALIKLPGDPTNCTFGDGKWQQTLFITAQGPKPNEGTARRYGLYQISLGDF